ncbi:hypothetical protein LPJ61_006240, partial [Coemansia biformis]
KMARIVVAGGNYTGLNAMRYLYAALLAGPEPANVQITMVDRRDGFLHFIGMTRGLTEPDYGEQLWVPYSASPWLQHPQIAIKHDMVVNIDDTRVELGSGEQLEFDYLIIALGVSRFAPIGVQSRTKAEFLRELAETHGELVKAQSVAVVGGGAVGIEMAADLKADFPSKHVSLVHSRPKLLPGPFTDELRDHVADIMANRLGVDLVLGSRVADQEPKSQDMLEYGGIPEFARATATDVTMTLSDGSSLHYDYAIRCLGIRDHRAIINLPPSSSASEPIFGPSGLRVRATMQLDDDRFPHIYACGDICDHYKVKLAGVGMHGAFIAARNIARSILFPERGDLDHATQWP